MFLHAVMRYFDWRAKNPEKTARDYFRFVVQGKFVTARVFSLVLLSFWLVDMPIGETKPSTLAPHTNLVAFGFGYMSDSITKHLFRRLRFLGSD